jgi:hypothetical protein
VKRERDKQDVRDRRDPKFEVLGSKFRKLQPSDHLTRPAFLASLACLARLFCGESQQFSNVHSVQIAPQCVMWRSRRFPYPIRTLVETHLGTDLEIFQASMKVVLCIGI